MKIDVKQRQKILLNEYENYKKDLEEKLRKTKILEEKVKNASKLKIKDLLVALQTLASKVEGEPYKIIEVQVPIVYESSKEFEDFEVSTYALVKEGCEKEAQDTIKKIFLPSTALNKELMLSLVVNPASNAQAMDTYYKKYLDSINTPNDNFVLVALCEKNSIDIDTSEKATILNPKEFKSCIRVNDEHFEYLTDYLNAVVNDSITEITYTGTSEVTLEKLLEYISNYGKEITSKLTKID